MATTSNSIPQVSAPLVTTQDGKITAPWFRFLNNLFLTTGGNSGGVSPVTTVVVTSSPFTYTATAPVHLWIAPGCYCSVTLTRGTRQLPFGFVTRGIFPMSVGDVITLRFTNFPPTVYVI